MSKIWTPAERARTALTLGQPDEVPTFELEFQLSEELFGYSLWDARLTPENYQKMSQAEIEKAAESDELIEKEVFVPMTDDGYYGWNIIVTDEFMESVLGGLEVPKN